MSNHEIISFLIKKLYDSKAAIAPLSLIILVPT